MKEIYVQADKVLVIDSEVVAHDLSDDPYKLLSRIRLSNWLRRLWTFQEGFFAASLFFLVGEEPVALAEIIEMSNKRGQHPLSDTLAATMWNELLNWFRVLFLRSFPQISTISKNSRFKSHLTEGWVSEVIQQISTRACTDTKDEPGCLAFLLNVDHRPIRDAVEASTTNGTTKGMIKLLTTLDNLGRKLNPPGCIPPCIIALPGKRMDVKGFKWSPVSFLIGPNRWQNLTTHPFQVLSEYPSTELMLRASGVLCSHGNGLRVMFPGLILDEIKVEGRMNTVFLVDTPHETRAASDVEIPGRPLSTWRIAYAPDESDLPWESVAPEKDDSGKRAIIILSYGRSWRNGVSGILVKLLGKCEDGSISVESIYRVAVSGTPEYDDHKWVKEHSKRIKGSWLPVDQYWCVD
jgi:hypothetical protein